MEFKWDATKNATLKAQRGVTFEDIVSDIGAGRLVDVLRYPNSQRYPNQELYLVNHNNYIYVVPVEIASSTGIALMKTIYPCRKYNREYLP